MDKDAVNIYDIHQKKVMNYFNIWKNFNTNIGSIHIYINKYKVCTLMDTSALSRGP